jgi:hypothetical protein
MSHAEPKHSDDCQYIRRWHCALDCHYDAVEAALDADRAHIVARLRELTDGEDAREAMLELREMLHKIERGES